MPDYYYFDLPNILLNLKSKPKFDVIEELLNNTIESHQITDKHFFLENFKEREQKGSTGLQQGIAIPHIKTNKVDKIHLVIGIYPSGIEFDALDGKPVKVVLLSIVPQEHALVHLKFISQLSRTLLEPVYQDIFINAKNKEAIYQLVKEKIVS